MPCWFDLCWECEHQVTQIFHCSTSDHESTIRIDLRVTDKFQQVGKFANMKSANNEKELYILSSTNLDHYKRQKQIYQLHLQNILCLTFSMVKLPTL